MTENEYERYKGKSTKKVSKPFKVATSEAFTLHKFIEAQDFEIESMDKEGPRDSKQSPRDNEP